MPSLPRKLIFGMASNTAASLKTAIKDLSSFLVFLEENGELVRIKESVNTEKDVGDYMYKSAVEGGPALLFENVRSDELGIKYDMPLVGSLITTRKRAALALGCLDESMAMERCLYAQDHPIQPLILEKDPYKRKVLTESDIDLLRVLPISKCSPKDGGKYIGTGLHSSKDPKFGRNLAICRNQILGKNRIGLDSESPKHTRIFEERAWERGEKFQISVALSCSPTITISSQFKPPIGVDETSFAGPLIGEPVRLVRGKTIDVEFPAESHIVIEGEVTKGNFEREGPFGEYRGYYGSQYERQTVIDVKALIIREDIQPICYGPLPMPVENDVIKQIPVEASIFSGVRRSCPGVKNIRCPWYGGSFDFIIVQLHKTYEEEGKIAILSAMSATNSQPKIVVVVDEDVEIHDDNQILNAITYRMQPLKDVVIVKTQGRGGDPSFDANPSAGSSAMGIDATKPLSAKYAEKIENHKTNAEIPKPEHPK
jgi:2,5-furandicarboxylate decarboxylase 1